MKLVLDKDVLAPVWADLRQIRTQLLTACDWTQLPDAALTAQEKQAWLLYRQALRDLTKNLIDPRNPQWPTPPGSSIR